jgi:hypothetical protein
MPHEHESGSEGFNELRLFQIQDDLDLTYKIGSLLQHRTFDDVTLVCLLCVHTRCLLWECR